MSTVEAPRKTNEEIKAELDALLVEAVPEPITDRATLADMIGEGKSIRKRGVEFLLIPPSIDDLAGITRLLNLQATVEENDEQNRFGLEIARRLLWVKTEDTLRPAAPEELTRCWTTRGLADAVRTAMRENGLQVDEGNE